MSELDTSIDFVCQPYFSKKWLDTGGFFV
ncbi:hypothetical protein TRIP_B200096 [uncultured Desulfatiglans sp.]|uniref:Uncharacterized protein n=1 Tax=Uncultured Desulfatiglans sp. TaxID=1748965 RepID=A0A653A1P8_UNCDX|nr:hypothetical protein TRIP_B200096 [uncultured Desulfatiglans sp.]